MRASDLLGQTVHLPDGSERVVVGLRAVQDGPPRGLMAGIRLDAVIVSNRHAGAYLGYQDRDQQGPWLIGAIVRRLHRGTTVLPWADVRDQLLSPSD
jgi:hypothetical protein